MCSRPFNGGLILPPSPYPTLALQSTKGLEWIDLSWNYFSSRSAGVHVGLPCKWNRTRRRLQVSLKTQLLNPVSHVLSKERSIHVVTPVHSKQQVLHKHRSFPLSPPSGLHQSGKQGGSVWIGRAITNSLMCVVVVTVRHFITYGLP